MDRFQPIYDIAELCVRKRLRHVVLSPGSRCAPLTLAFTRHKKLECKTISDERSAAFIGLGIAQQTKNACILVCTSGTAAYNFAPAVAEGFFSNTPLLVFTADRPSEWVAQQDGQTIYQYELFGKHVKKSFQLPSDYEHPDSIWTINRIVNEAINLALEYPQGPVHINAPFREPLYPSAKDKFRYSKDIRVIESIQSEVSLIKQVQEILEKEFSNYSRILIVGGQQDFNEELNKVLAQISQKQNILVVGDILSNTHSVSNLIKSSDLFLGQVSDSVKKSLQPDLLVSFGGAVISKNLKIFLRKYAPQAHWHIQPAGTPPDTFQHLTKVIHANPVSFLTLISEAKSKQQIRFQKSWQTEDKRVHQVIQKFFPQPEFGELELVKEVINHLPVTCNLHLANSMSVRYANFIGLTPNQRGVRALANRGTSGIDGCTSTAVGHSLTSEVPNVLITGDMAFFYDRNAFWNNYRVDNLRIVVLNNHGGIIFNMIDGPAALLESEEFFVTQQKLTAKKLCEEFGFDHLTIKNKSQLKNKLQEFLTFDGRTKVLELESSIELNKSVFEKLKQKIKK